MIESPDKSGWAIPLTEAEIARASRDKALPIPDPCAQGVAANLALLARHVAVLRGEDGTTSR